MIKKMMLILALGMSVVSCSIDRVDECECTLITTDIKRVNGVIVSEIKTNETVPCDYNKELIFEGYTVIDEMIILVNGNIQTRPYELTIVRMQELNCE